MNFAVTEGEQTVTELARKVFALGARPSQADVRKAERALVAVNPFLRRPAELPEGTIVAVPPLPDAEPTPDTGPLEGIAAGAFASAVKEALTGANESFKSAAEADRRELGDALELLRSAEVRRLVRSDEELPARVKEAVDVANAQLKAVQELEDYGAKAFEQLDEDVTALLAAFGAE
jgi:hypothetical protein